MNKYARGIPSSTVRFVRGLEDPFFMREEVADTLGVSPTMLKRFGDANPDLKPTAMVQDGRKQVYLYSPADVTRLEAYIETRWPIRANGLRARKAGRPTLWTPQERKERQSRQCRVRYLRWKASECVEAGLEEVGADYQRKADEIRAALRAEYDERFAYSTRPRVCA